MSNEVEEFIRSEVGQVYRSEWLTVDQATIQAFADATHDWNFLHVDPDAAGKTEFGTTIAHGFLVLSLIVPLRADLPRPRFPNLRMGVNYGLEQVRWVQPVRSGRRIRGTFTIAEIAAAGPSRYREVMDVHVEVEDSDRPAMVARWLTMYFQ